MNLNSKYNVKLGALCGRVFPDYTDAVEKAPFDIDKNHMKIPTNEERIKVSQNLRSYLEITFLHFEMVTVLIKIDLHFLHFHVFCKWQEDVKNAHEKVRRAMSPTTRQRVEEEK